MSGCGIQPFKFEFSPQDIEQAAAQGRLLSMEIEFSLKCNLRCPYCYVTSPTAPRAELTPAEIRDVILQAKDLGARKIVILGGEPLIYPRIMEKIEYIRSLGMQVELFTNGVNLTPARAKRLYDLGVNVVLKINSFKDDVQDKLVGVPGAAKKMRAALAHLQEAGYPDGEGFLAVSSVICRENFTELTALWIWLRDQGILPYLEIITPQGGRCRTTGSASVFRRSRSSSTRSARSTAPDTTGSGTPSRRWWEGSACAIASRAWSPRTAWSCPAWD